MTQMSHYQTVADLRRNFNLIWDHFTALAAFAHLVHGIPAASFANPAVSSQVATGHADKLNAAIAGIQTAAAAAGCSPLDLAKRDSMMTEIARKAGVSVDEVIRQASVASPLRSRGGGITGHTWGS